ncbi:MAG: transposase, partial [Flavobacteriales bacterium]|nr:transposase [Flavobacteriales bacterium]
MLTPQKYYHIYNRANGFENLFVNEGNYNFFLEKVKHHLSPILNIYAYCLMPNHFHLLVEIKSKEEIISVIESQISNYKESRTYLKFQTLDKFVSYFISKQFSNLF